MAITGKQRAQLRALVQNLEVVVHIGKDGVTSNVVTSADQALTARELIKCKVLENSLLTAREACDELSAACHAEQVQVIGTKFVLYKRNPKNPVIKLVKEKKNDFRTE